MLKSFISVTLAILLVAGSTFAADLVTTPDGQPRALAAGEVVKGPATVRTAAGGELIVSPESALQVQAPEGDLELFLVTEGSVRGNIGQKTQVAIPTGWLTVKSEERVLFYAETLKGATKRGFVKVDSGRGLLIFKKLHVHLSQGNGVEIEEKPNGAIRFTTHQTNASKVHMILRVTDELEIDLKVPKASTGTLSQEQKGRKTRLVSDPISWKSGQVALETFLEGASTNTGSLGPGTYAVIDNATGVLELAFDVVDFQIIKRATSLTSELSSLAVSNFFGFEAPK